MYVWHVLKCLLQEYCTDDTDDTVIFYLRILDGKGNRWISNGVHLHAGRSIVLMLLFVSPR